MSRKRKPCGCNALVVCESHHEKQRRRVHVTYAQMVEYARVTCNVCDECGGCATHKTCTKGRNGMFSSPKGHPQECILGLSQTVGPWPS